MFLLFVFIIGVLLPHASTVRYACEQKENSCGCPYRPPITTKIVDGEVARSHSWSWIVSLRYQDRHFCGGTILNERFVITAAHCFLDKLVLLPNMTICAGIDRLSDLCSQTSHIANVTFHHGFTLRTVENDIALLHLTTPVNFSDPFVSRICLPNTTQPDQYPEIGTYVVAAGWGEKYSNGKATNELRQVSLKVLNKTAPICASNTFNSRVQLCAYAPGKDTCRGDSGGPLMAFTRSKQWELVGIISYGRDCGNHEYSSGYTRVASYQDFIAQVINGTYIKPATQQCTCQCPYGNSQGVANTNEHSPEACVSACINMPLNRCTSHNTYACLGQNCAHSNHYTNLTEPMLHGRYRCTCECPQGNDQGLTYALKNSTQACVSACIAIPLNECYPSNTYACLDTSCAYSSNYTNGSSSLVTTRYQCTCQCPYGNDQGVAYTNESTPYACVTACVGVSLNECYLSNTYACQGTTCVYSDVYTSTTSTSAATTRGSHRCTCQCPYGSDQGVAYATHNSSAACVDACRMASGNLCHSGNTYACLGTDCAFSPLYSRRCSCQCPFGTNETFFYTSINSTDGCVNACIIVFSDDCTPSNTYACLDDRCSYSTEYDNTSAAFPVRQECTCQCPYGSNAGVALTKGNTSESCVRACMAVSSNPCVTSNTYACLATDCAYSIGYVNTTPSIGTSSYRCTCQCPYGNDQGVAYATEDSPHACISACIGVSSNRCINSNTYACLGTRCVYSSSYASSTLVTMTTRYRCSCECPYGNDQGFAIAKENSTEACVCACRATLSNRCVADNTYACLGANCMYSSTYNHSQPALPERYRCTCQCPYGNDQGWAFATENTSAACVDACRIASGNSCDSGNTYACLDTDCAFSSSYLHRCSCQCPFGNSEGSFYASVNNTEGCVNACIAVSSNNCIWSNTYACLDDRCDYSAEYDNTSAAISVRQECTCQCPYEFNAGVAFTKGNTSESCVGACMAVLSNPCDMSNTYACLGTSCAYSSNYTNASSSLVTTRYQCTCQCPYGNDQGVAYASVDSPYACISACIGVSSNRCVSSNTYACLGTDCAYSPLYSRRCSCQCPFGNSQGSFYTTVNNTEGCVNACIAVPSNDCIPSNTYACLDGRCTHSVEYDNSSIAKVTRFRCSCYCPYDTYQGIAWTKSNTSESCVPVCVAVSTNDCLTRNTYACLDSDCSYSSSYEHSSTTIVPSLFRCSCQCPYGHNQGLAYASENSSEACVNACQSVTNNPCVDTNTYACLGSDCQYSSGYSNNSASIPAGYRCVCQCPYGSNEGFAYANENTAEACVSACKSVPWNSCDSSNTYACREEECTYSDGYIN